MPQNQLTITLQSDASVPLRFVGPSLWGEVYKHASHDSPCFFRLIPRQHAKDSYYDFGRCNQITDLIGKPIRPQIATVVEAGQVNLQGIACLYVKYEAPGARSLQEMVNGNDRRQALFLIANVFRALPVWWQHNGAGFLPMPSDIVAVDHWPVLLALPCQDSLPRFESLTEEKSRILFLAPEILRGALDRIDKKNIDLYACCALAFQAMFAINPDTSAEALLSQAAAGVLYDSQKLATRLPNWSRKLESFGKALATVRNGLCGEANGGSRIDPSAAAEMIEDLVAKLDPVDTAKAMCDERQYEKAVAFISDVVLEQNSFDLLMLAGFICRDLIDRSYGAVDFFERAIICQSERPQPYLEQFNAILKAALVPSRSLGTPKRLSDADLQNKAERDFNRLTPDQFQTYAPRYAEFLLVQKSFQKAARVMYQRMHYTDPQGNLRHYWWEIANTLLYAHAMLGYAESDAFPARERLEQLDGLTKFIATGLKQPLNYLNKLAPGDQRRLDDAVVGRFGMEIIHLEERIKEIRKRLSP